MWSTKYRVPLFLKQRINVHTVSSFYFICQSRLQSDFTAGVAVMPLQDRALLTPVAVEASVLLHNLIKRNGYATEFDDAGKQRVQKRVAKP